MIDKTIICFPILYSFNVIRLCLSWSALEPTPGNYSEMYLQRVEQVIIILTLKLR